MNKVEFLNLKKSEILLILAAVLEIIESEGFEADLNFGIQEDPNNEDYGVMVFTKDSIEPEELNRTKKALGERFIVQVFGKCQNTVWIKISGPKEDLKNFLTKHKDDTPHSQAYNTFNFRP